MFGLLNVFTGGALDNLSIVMLGLGPYITATIIFQLLTMIFPQLEKMYKEEGERAAKNLINIAELQPFLWLLFRLCNACSFSTPGQSVIDFFLQFYFLLQF